MMSISPSACGCLRPRSTRLRGKRFAIGCCALVISALTAMPVRAIPGLPPPPPPPLPIIYVVPPLYQDDYPGLIDHSTFSIAAEGCGLTTFTMLVNYQLAVSGVHAKNPDGSVGGVLAFTPAELNTLFNNFRVQRKKRAPDKSIVSVTYNGWGQTIAGDGSTTETSSGVNVAGAFLAIFDFVKTNSFEQKALNQDSFFGPGFGKIPEIPVAGLSLAAATPYIMTVLGAGRPVTVRVGYPATTGDPARPDSHYVTVVGFFPTPGQPMGVGRFLITDPARGNKAIWLDDPMFDQMVYGFEGFTWKDGSAAAASFTTPGLIHMSWTDLHDPLLNPEQYDQPYLISRDGASYIGRVPEPSQWLLLISGWAMVGGIMRRQPRRKIAA